ncbi:peptidoglycan-binding domain-containing protein [Brunnivagina elsteri]|uniref:Peptidoglycan-binding protein n=1 Tax=Brunnivagina elsteri CCALA 953 TaxID=987040 RepID=A0A2A2TE06_9CYAN|nr:peptidoglycan-binding domain-containing protein [Calothrix elsteri]PAX51888.1 peptidoglycan-binding protein [Calothrix elsteri CCALA 953]
MNAASTVLKEGSRGQEVVKLQEGLKKLNFYSGAIDGIFGVGTKDAVIKFQRSQGLAADGIVGAKTLSKLNEILGNNMSENKWSKMTPQQEIDEIKSLINSRMGVAALNQAALEGFVGFNCTRRYYINNKFGGLQTLMRLNGGSGGVSTAIGYEEIRVTFNRFESNIENFEIERVSSEIGAPKFELPD